MIKIGLVGRDAVIRFFKCFRGDKVDRPMKVLRKRRDENGEGGSHVLQ